MSKLSDKIRKALRLETAPLGFRAAARERTRSLVVVVQLDDADPKKIAAAVEKGADIILLRLAKVGEKEAKEAVEAAGETPCGVWSEVVDGEDASRLAAADVDYLVLGAEKTPAPVLLEDKVGYVLVLEGELSDIHLRTVDLLPLDAVLMSQGVGPLTVRAQMELRRIAGLTRKPVMLPVSPQIAGAELECLRDSGVVLLLIDGGEKGTLEALPTLRQAIEALPAPRRRREERMGAVLPQPSEVAFAAEGEEEEEEEEDDM